jgi:hypothetical protein
MKFTTSSKTGIEAEAPFFVTDSAAALLAK